MNIIEWLRIEKYKFTSRRGRMHIYLNYLIYRLTYGSIDFYEDNLFGTEMQ